jgi:hypothetical protein
MFQEKTDIRNITVFIYNERIYVKVAISRICGKPHYFTKKGVGAVKASLTLTIFI